MLALGDADLASCPGNFDEALDLGDPHDKGESAVDFVEGSPLGKLGKTIRLEILVGNTSIFFAVCLNLFVVKAEVVQLCHLPFWFAN